MRETTLWGPDGSRMEKQGRCSIQVRRRRRRRRRRRERRGVGLQQRDCGGKKEGGRQR